MDSGDRELLIRIDERVREINEHLPVIIERVEKHERFLNILGAGLLGVGSLVVAIMAGFWERIFK